MSTQTVTPAQVLAAQMLIELQLEDNEQPDAALYAIAQAQESPGMAATEAAPQQRVAEALAADLVAAAIAADADLAIIRPDGAGGTVVETLELRRTRSVRAAADRPADEVPEAAMRMTF